MKQSKTYVRANRDQQLLLPPDVNCYISDGHFARWLVRIIDLLDLSKFTDRYEHDDMDPVGRGRPPYHPSMLLAILIYGASRRFWTFRRLEQMTYSDVGARYITGNLHPDHSCIAKFRKQHADAIDDLFSQVVLACRQAGIVDLQNVALDSVVIPADASRQSSVKINELEQKFDEAKAIAKSLMDRMEAAEAAECDALKEELHQAKNREKRLQEAIAFLESRKNQSGDSSQDLSSLKKDLDTEEEQQLAEAASVRAARELKGLSSRGLAKLLGFAASTVHQWEHGAHRIPGDKREALRIALDLDHSSLPDLPPTQQAESRKAPTPTSVILSDFEAYWIYRPNCGYRVGYLGMATVDSKNQVIIDASVSERNADAPNLIPSLERIHDTFARWPSQFSGDTGFYSHDNQDFTKAHNIQFYSPPQALQKGHEPSDKSKEMREKLATPEGRRAYNTRSAVVEPVFGNIKFNMGFVRFWTTRHRNVSCEWSIACTTHNLLKLFRHVAAELAMKAFSPAP